MKNPMLIVLFLCAVGALGLAAFEFHNKQWFAASYIAVIGLSAIVMIGALVRVLSRLDIPLDAADPAGGRIVMQVAGATLSSTLYWAVGFFLTSVGLVECPGALWTRWLSYPAAFVALLLMGLMLVITMSQKLERVVADSSGIRVITETRGLTDSEILGGRTRDLTKPETTVGWGQVGAVKRVEVKMRRVSRQQTSTTLVRREFVLLDREGNELLNIEEPLDPPDRYQRFLESIPRWTGLQVQNASVTE